MIPPVAPDGSVLSVRRFRDRALPLDAFCPADVAAVVDELVERRSNVVVSGPTSSGKTSLLNSVLGRVSPGERLVVVEDTAELLPHHDHLVRLEARPATPDGLPVVTLADLVRTAMRLRPDRLVVGEVRGAEVVGLMQALNTGHDGSWSTCHANSALDALHRLETLVIQAAPAWPLVAVRAHLARSVDAVVHVTRTAGVARRIVEIGEVVEPDGDGPLRLRPIADDATRARRAGAEAAMTPAATGLVAAAAVLVLALRLMPGRCMAAPRRPGDLAPPRRRRSASTGGAPERRPTTRPSWCGASRRPGPFAAGRRCRGRLPTPPTRCRRPAGPSPRPRRAVEGSRASGGHRRARRPAPAVRSSWSSRCCERAPSSAVRRPAPSNGRR